MTTISHGQQLTTSREASARDWSPDSVIRAIRRSLGLVALSYTPYFPELFDDGLIDRVTHPAEMRFDPDCVSRPWQIEAAGKRYFVPGSTDDLIIYTSCVIACCPQILRAWTCSGQSEDCGPPTVEELLLGQLGEQPWKRYWNELHNRSKSIVNSGYSWVLNADIEKCAEKIDTKIIATLFAEWGSDPSAVRIFTGMHSAWQQMGFPGLPIIGTFSLLNRFYLLEVEQCLRRRDVVFLRATDDFRVFCKSPAEEETSLQALRECLALRNLRLNERKSLFQKFGEPEAIMQRWRLIIKSKFRYGAFRPVLVLLTRWKAIRPISLVLLKAMVQKVSDDGR